MGKHFARTRLAFLSAVLLGVTACSTDASAPPASSLPATSPTPAPTTPAPVASTGSSPETPASTATVTIETMRPEIDIAEPEKYPEMANDDIDGADTAARYFLDLYEYTFESGDLTAWNQISDPNCVICENVRSRVTQAYEKGHWFEDFSLLHGPSGVYCPTEEVPYYIVVLEVTGTARVEYGPDGDIIYQGTETFFPEYAIGVQYRAPNMWTVIDADPQEYAN